MHTDIPTRADLEGLLSVRNAACVSIYVPTAPEERENAIASRSRTWPGRRSSSSARSSFPAARSTKVRLRQYVRQVDGALRQVLSGLELPLILAAAEPLASIFRSACAYPHLAGVGIAGNPDEATDAELADAARGVLDPLYAGELAVLHDLYARRVSRGRGSDDLGAISRAATLGAVDNAFVDIDETIPGFIDEMDGALMLDRTDDAVNYGVVDEIARRVLLTRGRVLAVRRDDIPGSGPAAAILRYPV